MATASVDDARRCRRYDEARAPLQAMRWLAVLLRMNTGLGERIFITKNSLCLCYSFAVDWHRAWSTDSTQNSLRLYFFRYGNILFDDA